MRNQMAGIGSSLTDWTTTEKRLLLEGIKEYGSKDLIQLSVFLKKSPSEVDKAIKFFRDKTKIVKNSRFLYRYKNYYKKQVPLVAWIKMILNNESIDSVNNDIPSALRLIADCEDMPQSIHTQGINFKQIYNYLADLLEGKTVHTNKHFQYILDKCILETAIHSKNFINKVNFKQFMKQHLKLKNKSFCTFNHPLDSDELTALKYLMKQKAYNPLFIPLEKLKPQ